MINHVPNILQVFCTKKSLAECAAHLDSAVPETYDLADKADRRKFVEEIHDGIWICKPHAMNQGKGIFLVHDLAGFKESLQESRPSILQRYIERPLLFDGFKFDIRFFALIARCKPLTVLGYRHCYGRKSLNAFDAASPDLLTHLTNAFQQKKHPEYAQRKEESILSEEVLATVMDLEQVRAKVFEAFTRVVSLKKAEIILRDGCFELLGLDVVVDEQMNPHLIEINTNPAMWTDTQPQKRLFPKLVDDSLAVVLKTHENDPHFLDGTAFTELLREE